MPMVGFGVGGWLSISWPWFPYRFADGRLSGKMPDLKMLPWFPYRFADGRLQLHAVKLALEPWFPYRFADGRL